MTAVLPRILVVDDAVGSLAVIDAHLQSRFELCVERDQESSWQSLVLDGALSGILVPLSAPRFSGLDLLERVRASKVRRLRELPVVLFGHDLGDSARERPVLLGVNDFLDLASCADSAWDRITTLFAAGKAALDEPVLMQDQASGLFTGSYLEFQAAQALSYAARHGADLSIMVLGFDVSEALLKRLGTALVKEVGLRFARMLAVRMRTEDSLGHFGDGLFAIVSPGTSAGACAAFAERVRQAVELARVSVNGDAVALTVSVGVSSANVEGQRSAAELLDLAAHRMRQASVSGGNRVVLGDEQQSLCSMSVHHALELLLAGKKDAVRPHLAKLGGDILPLLKLLDAELGLGLPLVDLADRLKNRAN